jgi:hypothetical protein
VRRECPWDGKTYKEVNSSHTTDLVPSRSEVRGLLQIESPATRGEKTIFCWDWIGCRPAFPLVCVTRPLVVVRNSVPLSAYGTSDKCGAS